MWSMRWPRISHVWYGVGVGLLEGVLGGSMMGGSLGVWKGVLWMCFWGILTEILFGRVNGCDIRSFNGVFLGNFQWTQAG